MLEFDGSVGSTARINFDSFNGGALELTSPVPNSFNGVVSGFVGNDMIEVANAASATLSADGTTLTVNDASNNVLQTIHFSTSYAGDAFNVFGGTISLAGTHTNFWQANAGHTGQLDPCHRRIDPVLAQQRRDLGANECRRAVTVIAIMQAEQVEPVALCLCGLVSTPLFARHHFHTYCLQIDPANPKPRLAGSDQDQKSVDHRGTLSTNKSVRAPSAVSVRSESVAKPIALRVLTAYLFGQLRLDPTDISPCQISEPRGPMKSETGKPSPASVLMEIISAQTDIAQLGLDLGGVMAFVTERVQQLTGASGAIVELAEGDEMVYRAASGIAKHQLGLRLQRTGSLSGLCVGPRTVLRCDDFESDVRVDREVCRKVGLRSMVVAPLNHGETTVGVLKIAAAVPNVFSAEHVQILELMCGLIASAMYHSVRYETNELYHRATHDALTGLANRALFYDRLRRSLSLAHRQSSQLGILNLDLDGLKPINDQFGHRAGDAAIRETGQRISKVSRQSDTVAQLGGDEFAVIAADVNGRDNVTRHADRLANEIRKPFSFEGKELALDASIGLALFPDDGIELDTLIEKADQAMYAIKRTRKTHRH